MQSLQTLLLVAQVLIAVSLIGIILIQHGKGADAGAAFGSGASSTVFGSQGSSNFLTRSTAVLAFLFLANSLTLAYIATHQVTGEESVMATEGVAPERPQEGTEMQVPAGEMDLSGTISDEDIPAVPQSDEEMPQMPASESEVPQMPDK